MTQLRWGVATHTGRVRTINQDRVVVTPNLFAVADGMGGHLGGEVAAQMITDVLTESFSAGRSPELLVDAVETANRAVWDRSRSDPKLHGMGTTLTAVALVTDGESEWLELVNVGDSRAYLWRAGQLSQLTDDHSLVEEMVRSGELSPEAAATHPGRHILTRALGIDEQVVVDIWMLEANSGDRILICSDGLFNEIGDDGIATVLGGEPDPQAAADRMVDLAEEHGGNDNITALVVNVDEAPQGAPRTVIGSTSEEVVRGRGQRRPAQTDEAARAASSAGGIADEEAASAVPERGTGRSRRPRRRGGIATAPPSRRLTGLSLIFSAAVVVVLAGAVGAIYWYAGRSWYVTISGSRVAIYQGRPGGVLWIGPKLVDRTTLRTSQVLASNLPELEAGVEESSLVDAYRYVDNLRLEYQRLPIQPTTTTVPTVSTSTTPTTGHTTSTTTVATTTTVTTTTTVVTTTTVATGTTSSTATTTGGANPPGTTTVTTAASTAPTTAPHTTPTTAPRSVSTTTSTAPRRNPGSVTTVTARHSGRVVPTTARKT